MVKDDAIICLRHVVDELLAQHLVCVCVICCSSIARLRGGAIPLDERHQERFAARGVWRACATQNVRPHHNHV